MKAKHVLLTTILLTVSVGIVATAAIGINSPTSDRRAVLITRTPGSQINVRTAPTTLAPNPYFGVPGDSVKVLKEQQGDDGFTWYYVKFDQKAGKGWIRSDLISLQTGELAPKSRSVVEPRQTYPQLPSPEVTTPLPVPPSDVPPSDKSIVPAPDRILQQPGNSPQPSYPSSGDFQAFNIDVPSPEQSPQSNAGAPLPSDRPATSSTFQPGRSAYVPSTGYTSDQITYFLEVALGSEFGTTNSKIRKWQEPIRIGVHGSPTPEDLSTLQTVISELNTLTNGGVQLQRDDRNPNLQMYFVPESQFRRYEANYRQKGTRGFTWVYWTQDVIQRGNILIDTAKVTQAARNHVIREELTQSLGLLQDSYRHKDSVFFQGWNGFTHYAEIDKVLIQMLYRPDIRPGMGRSEILSVLSKFHAQN